MAKKIKILFLAANPSDVKYRLRLEEEFKEIRKKLRASKERDSFKLVSEWAVTPDDLQGVLSEHKPHIVHFSGHGSQTEGIALEDKSGNTFLLDKQAFAELLEIMKDNIRMVVLNACYATDQAREIRKIIDFTIGMNKAVGDKAAIVFAAYLYQNLADGRSVQDAFRLATTQLKIFKIPDSETPELLVRYGVDPNEEFKAWRQEQKNKVKPDKPAHDHPPSRVGGIFNNAEETRVGVQAGEVHIGEARTVFGAGRGRRRKQLA
jgi:hypothetical protein